MLRSLYLTYGLIVLAGLGYAEYRGLSVTPIDEVKNVPKSIRDNPGAYRAHYASYHRYSGGK
jgi:hypothetical protein